MKPDKSLYPITVSLLENHKLLTHELFAYYKFHKGAFIGLFLLQDVFPDSFIGELYESLDLNERLAIERADGKENGVLSAKRVAGTVIGSLPRAESTLANMLISRGYCCNISPCFTLPVHIISSESRNCLIKWLS